MPRYAKTLFQYSNNGKTFFFNAGKTKNGDDFLAINTIYGKGSKERIVIFPSQFLEVYKYFGKAIEELTGFRAPAGVSKEVSGGPSLPGLCPECEMGPAGWEITTFSGGTWRIDCGSCQNLIYTTEAPGD